MSSLQILPMLVLFVVTVISPYTDIGTRDLPATGAKSIVRAEGDNRHKPNGHGQSCLVAIEVLQCDLRARFSDKIVWRSVRTAANLQLSVPLLI